MIGNKVDRRNFLKAGGVSALGTQIAFADGPALAQNPVPSTPPHEKGFPLLAIITEYSPQKLAFAASTDYQGVVVKAIPTSRRSRAHGRRYLISFPASVWASNSILRIWYCSISTASKRRGISKNGSWVYTPRIPRSSSRFCKRWEYMVRGGGVTASPARG